MTTMDLPTELETYLAAVRGALSDLPATERDDLLAEVEASLRDAAAEGGAIGARLGSPEEFATELRLAAGLHDVPAAPPRRSLRASVARVAAGPRVAVLRARAQEAAPVWWVARGYVAVAGIAVVAGAGWSTRYPAVPRFGSAEVGVAVVLAAVAASFALGVRTRGGTVTLRRAALACSAICVVLAVPVVQHLARGTVAAPAVVTLREPVTQPGLVYDGVPVQNIYPYTRDGKLLHDVLLYDGAGRPLDIGAGVNDPNRRVLRTTSNVSVLNAFPIRYYEPGTVRVAHPNAGPPVRTPTILPGR